MKQLCSVQPLCLHTTSAAHLPRQRLARALRVVLAQRVRALAPAILHYGCCSLTRCKCKYRFVLLHNKGTLCLTSLTSAGPVQSRGQGSTLVFMHAGKRATAAHARRHQEEL